MDFAKVEKRVRTTGGGSTRTVRNLRIREDTAKYLLNLDVNSAHYDPKTRSMREDPLLDSDLNEKFYGGDNQYRVSGQAMDFKQLNIHDWEAFEKGQDIHIQEAPSQVELLFKNHKVIKAKLKNRMKDTIMDKYGNAASEEELLRELLLGQSEREVEYDRAGRIIKGQANIALKEATEERPAQNEEKRLATWGTDIPEDLVLDQKLLTEALKKEDERKREERDERKRKHNVKWNDEVTAKDMEAYRMKKVHHDDPMRDFLH